MPEPFAQRKPERAFRVFVFGESSAAGFPYPRNGTFSRLVRDVLRDILPEDSVEVVNLGIAAINSFAMHDMAGEVARQRPDAILIYAGHNEYYGVLGVGSRQRALAASAPVVRGYLRILRSSLVVSLRRGIVWLQTRSTDSRDLETASLMEALGRDQEIQLGSAAYREGLKQLEANLDLLIGHFRRAGVPVLLGSVASNLRDLEPFAATANAAPGGALDVYREARDADAAGDSARARELYIRARDLDVVRFRAPGELNDVIRRVSRRTGSIYVPVEEAFATASPAGVPGENLFLEHVHPNRDGYALIARTFLDAMRDAGVLGPSARPERMRPWSEYVEGTTLTPFDERIALHTKRTIEARWPFVPLEAQRDYRGSYQPLDLLDSLALAVSRGAPWERAKLQLAADYERRTHFDSAAAEYAGLARDAAHFEEPHRLHGRALLAAGRLDEAEAVLRRALAIRPSAAALTSVGMIAAQRRDFPEAIDLFRHSLQLDPVQPAVLYQLSLAYGMQDDVLAARETAVRLARLAPDYPGLAEWLRTLGVAR